MIYIIGDNIKKIRKIQNISINYLSKKTGISLGYISELENNKARNPTMDKLKAIALVLGVEIEEFIKSETIDEKELNECGKKYNKNGELINYKKLTPTLNIIPCKFVKSTEARKYISMHQIFTSEGFDLNNLSDEDVLDFANEILKQLKLISYKYKNK